MKLPAFIQAHYSPQSGESPVGHAMAVLAGLVLMLVGAGLVFSVVFVPVGVVVGLLGLFIFGGGVFGHIRSPLKFSDLLAAVVSLAGAAIGATFTLAIAVFLIGFVVTVLILGVDWLRSAF